MRAQADEGRAVPIWRRPQLVGVAAVVALVLGVGAVALLLIIGGGGDAADDAEVEPEVVAALQSAVDAFGELEGEADIAQVRSAMGPPDAFTIAHEVADDGTATRREEWFYYELRTVFEFADGRLVSNLPVESSYGDFYLLANHYDPADFEMGATWEAVQAVLHDPSAFAEFELEPEYEIEATYYAGDQLILAFDDTGALFYVEGVPLAATGESE
jgi:hypothetical protein